MRVMTIAGVLLLVACASEGQQPPPPRPAKKEAVVPGFEHLADYTGPEGAVLGSLYRHSATGLQLRVLKNESVPQVFVHVKTLPASEGGEPHTGEHLLLGKGVRGKTLAAASSMSLVESTAYTDQTETCYSFNCAAGEDTFLRILEQTLRALWLPDYTDEEIRREVCHLSVTPNEDGSLRLEEQGTVYNEMVSTFERRWIVYYELARLVYGPNHPLSYVAGGRPEGIRELTPGDIRRFHARHYHPAGTGLILALPRATPAEEILPRVDAILTKLSQDPELAERPQDVAEVPPIHPAEPAGVLRVPYPTANEEDTGTLLLAWNPRAQAPVGDELLQVLFLSAFGDGEASQLHPLLIDRERRSLEVPASRVYAYLDTEDVYSFPLVGFSGFAAADDAKVEAILEAVQAEAKRIAELAADSEELARFNHRIRTRLVNTERGYKRALSSPPGFGKRSGRNFWVSHLRDVDRQGGARRSLILQEALDHVEAILEGGGNPWGEVIAQLGMLERPHLAVSEASKAEQERRAQARAARLERAHAALEAERPDETLPEALKRVQAEQADAAAAILARDAEIPEQPLVEDVPTSYDPHLPTRHFEVGGLPALAVEVEGLSATEFDFSAPLEGIRRDELVFLPLFPSLLTGVGIRGEEVTLAYDELAERLALEIGGLGASFELQPITGRLEFTVSASGVDPDEARLALAWLERCLREVDLTRQNLPRLRDLVLTLRRDLRGLMGRAEEGWVRNPAVALRHQTNPIYWSCQSIHTRLFHLARLTWLFQEPAEGEAARLGSLLEGLRARLADQAPGDALSALQGILGADAEPRDVGELGPCFSGEGAAEFRAGVGSAFLAELETLLSDLPEEAGPSLLRLAEQLAADLATPPAETLQRLREAWRVIAPRRGARVVLSGSPQAVAELAELGEAMLARLDGAPARPPASHDRTPRLTARALARNPDRPAPVHFGLVHPAGSSGVCVFGAPLGEPLGYGRDDLLTHLAAALDTGAGPHSFFMRTWGAGLAYSNGVRPSPSWGRMSYYAERCPDPAQTMRFVIDLARDPARHGNGLSDYALAQLVSAHRQSQHLATRARAAAADLLDRRPPSAIRRQREALLALRQDPDLWEAVRARYEAAVGTVLVGLGPKSRDVDGVFLTIANDALLDSWERYVREVEGEDEWVARIYPADYWLYPEK